MQIWANLTEAETRGYPVLLFWSKGRFLPVPPTKMKESEAVAFRAAVKDDAATLTRLLSEGLAANTCDSEGRSLVSYAAGAGALKALEVLKLNKADLAGSAKEKLLPSESSKEPSYRFYTASPLELAAMRGRTEVVRFLISNKVSRAGRDRSYDSPLYSAATNGHLETVKALLELKARIDEQTHSNVTSVIGAINEGYPDVSEFLLKEGASFEFGGENNRKAFLSVCREGKFAMARFFIEHGNNPKREIEGFYPLIEAAGKGSKEFAEYLLKQGALIDAQDDYKRSALIAACMAGNEAFARVLLAAGANVSLQAKSGTTALHAAVFRQKYDLVKALLAAGASTTLKNRNGLTPLDTAVVIAAWECVEPFLKAGGKLDTKSPILVEQLHSILRGDQVDLLAQLLQGGLPADYQTPGSWPLLRLAEFAQAKRCATLLREAGATLDENAPVPLMKASQLEPGFKLISGNAPKDPRPEEMAVKGASMRVRVLVDGEGRARFILIDECAEPLLCVGLSETVESWRFTPPKLGGKPAAIWVAQTVSFPSLKERNAAKPKPDVMPRVIKQSPPVYPYRARTHGAMAEVLLSFVVDEKGSVRNARVVRSSGEEFNAPAVDCVKQWKFSPATAKGVPVPVEMTVPIIFSISER